MPRNQWWRWPQRSRGDRCDVLDLAADGLDEAGDAGGSQRLEELFERPGRVKVGALLLEGGTDCFRGEVVEAEQEVLRVDRLDADRLAGFGREVVEVNVTTSSESAATAAASTCRSLASLVIAGSSRSISAGSTAASSKAARIACSMLAA